MQSVDYSTVQDTKPGWEGVVRRKKTVPTSSSSSCFCLLLMIGVGYPVITCVLHTLDVAGGDWDWILLDWTALILLPLLSVQVSVVSPSLCTIFIRLQHDMIQI